MLVAGLLLAACADRTALPIVTNAMPDSGVPTTVAARCIGTDAGSDGGIIDPDAGAMCTCPEGYQLDGKVCRLIDECAGEGVCGEHEACVPQVGGHDCVCAQGYSRDGGVCGMWPSDCAPCDAHATCVHESGGAFCRCSEGYTGDGLSCMESQTDPCAGGGGCGVHAVCARNGNTRTCTCDEGYVGDGFNCMLATDPCAELTCARHGTCAASGGEATCSCNSGYSGDGLTCSPTTSPGQVGDPCTGTLGTRGSCQVGKVCSDFGIPGHSVAACSVEPCSDGSCGSNGGIPNKCVGGSFCAAGCETSADCRNEALACHKKSVDSSTIVGLCFSDCRPFPAETCDYFAACNLATGGCDENRCARNSDCPVGQVCEPSEGTCVPDCTAGWACRGGSVCNQSTGICEWGAYKRCENLDGVCKSNMRCIFGPDSEGAVCLSDCSSGQACPSSPIGQACNVTLTSGEKYCGIDCTTNSGICPSATTCQSLGSRKYCLP